MNQTEITVIDRKTAADSISQMADVIGTKQGIVISECSWDIGDDYMHAYAHRLELSTQGKSVRIYFNDAELIKSADPVRKKRIEIRLIAAIGQLFNHSPSPTYAFN